MVCPILNGHVQTGFLHHAEAFIWQNIGHVAFGKFGTGLGTPRRWINLVQQADIFLVLGEMTKQATHTHMGTMFSFLQDCSPRRGDRDGCFLQQLNESELHSLVVQLAPERPIQWCWDTESGERLKPPVPGWVQGETRLMGLGQASLKLTVTLLPQPPKY